jgi:hypothetical protein
VPKDGECRFKSCCPGLFCISNATGDEACVTCKPTEATCQDNTECCEGLFCLSGKCDALEPI